MKKILKRYGLVVLTVLYLASLFTSVITLITYH